MGGAPMLHQTTTTMSHAAAMPMASGGTTHTVIVGGDAGLVYTPSEVIAAVGDVVHFVFMKNNHTVTQSTFDKPCNKKSADAPDSGFMTNTDNTIIPAPTFEYTVVSMDPTWWYCKQRTGTHCGKGMVFAINPTTEKTFGVFRDVAIQLNGTVTTSTAPAAAAIPTASATHTGGIVMGTPMANKGNSCQCQCLCPAGSFNLKPVNHGTASNPPVFPPASAMSTLITSTRTGWVSAIAPTPLLAAPVSIFTEAASMPATTPSVSEAMSVNTPAVAFIGTLTEGNTWAQSTPTIISAEPVLNTTPSTTIMSTAIPPVESLALETIPYAPIEYPTTASSETPALDIISSTTIESAMLVTAEPTAIASSETFTLDSTSSTMVESTASAETPMLDTTPSTMARSTATAPTEPLALDTIPYAPIEYPTTASSETLSLDITSSTMIESPTTVEATPTTSAPVFASSLILKAPVTTANNAEITSTPAQAAEPINNVAPEITEAAKFVNLNTIDLSGLQSAWTGGIQPTPL